MRGSEGELTGVLRDRLGGRLYVQTANGRVLHAFEPVMLVLALLVVPVILIDASDLGEPWDTVSYVLDWVIWAGFAAELVFILTVATNRARALRAHWLDVAIVAVSFPVLPALLSSARLIRLVRLLRLARLGLFGARAMTAARLVTSRKGFRYVALAVVLLVFVAGAAITVVEEEKFPHVWDGVWWAVTTVTTVGYGDLYPSTASGRVVAIVLMFVGLGFLSVLTATIASRFVEVDTEEKDRAAEEERLEIVAAVREIDERLGRLEEQLAELLRRSG